MRSYVFGLIIDPQGFILSKTNFETSLDFDKIEIYTLLQDYSCQFDI